MLWNTFESFCFWINVCLLTTFRSHSRNHLKENLSASLQFNLHLTFHPAAPCIYSPLLLSVRIWERISIWYMSVYTKTCLVYLVDWWRKMAANFAAHGNAQGQVFGVPPPLPESYAYQHTPLGNLAAYKGIHFLCIYINK